MTSFCLRLLPLVVACGVLFGPHPVTAAEDQPASQPAAANNSTPTITDQERTDARAIFAGQCAWCHGNFGMTAEKAPRLAGTKMTEQEVEERIRNGKQGYMPSFHRFLNDQQIALMAKYIKSLKVEN